MHELQTFLAQLVQFPKQQKPLISLYPVLHKLQTLFTQVAQFKAQQLPFKEEYKVPATQVRHDVALQVKHVRGHELQSPETNE